MKRVSKLSVLTVLLCIVVLGSLFFPLLHLDMSSVMDQTVPFSQQLKGVSGLLKASDSGTVLDIAGKDVLTTLTKDSSGLESAGRELLLLIRLLILIPGVSGILLILLGFFEKTFAKVLSVLFSLTGCAGLAACLAWVFPARLAGMIADKAGDTVSAVVTRITEGTEAAEAVEIVEESIVKASQLRSLILKGIRPALWAAAAALLLLVIVSILRLFVKKSTAVSGGHTLAQPAFVCSDGPLAGETIPLGEKDEISFGSDPAVANMVIERSDVAPFHCRIAYRQDKGQYCVTVGPDAPVLLKGKQLKSGENDLKRGSEIFLGMGDCSIRLL